MKWIISFCVVVAVVFAINPEPFPLPPESLNRMHNFAAPCVNEFKVDSSFVRRLGDPSIPRDELTNKFLYCFAVNSGIVGKDGHMVPERIAGIVGNHPLLEEILAAVSKCNEITKDDPVATTVAMHVCYGEIFPIRFVF